VSTSRAQHDVVVVGAGHNSLIAAAYLARCGLSVLVLEKNSYPGGGAVTRGLTRPGFLHDTHATAAVLLQASPVLTHDELGLLSKFDLRFVSPPNNEMTVFSDGDSLVWYRDLERTCQEIAKFSEQDAEVYRQTVRFVQGVLPLMGMSMARPPVSLGSFLSLVEKAPFGNELIVAMMQSSYEVIVQRFQHPKVQMALLRRSLTSVCGPEERGTGLNILMMMAAVHSLPLAIIVGGTQQLTQSTVRAIEAYGGSIRLNAPVKRIINSGGDARGVELLDGEVIHARRAVLASIHPHDLGEMVNGLDMGLLTRARRTTPSYFGTLMVHAALKEKVEWKVGDIAHQCTIVDLVDSSSVDDFRHMCDAPRWGIISKQFTTGVVVNTNYDSSRAPPGQHVMSSFNFVPYNLKDGGPNRWDELKAEYAEWVLDRITAYAPNVSVASVLAHAVESPLDLARYSPSFVAGDVMGLGSYLHQTMGMRPTPELSQYRVPGAGGLYLTGPFMHPGGGLTGGGRAVAIRVMEDLKVNYSKVIRI
jgi:phytoene dehydrogenase-like protein